MMRAAHPGYDNVTLRKLTTQKEAFPMTGIAVTQRESFEQEALPQLDTLFRTANHLTQDTTQAEDLVQETMLKAYRAWHQFSHGTNVRAWLLTILRHTFFDQYHKSVRAGETVDFSAVEEFTVFEGMQHADPERRFYDQLLDDEILKAIDTLPESFREVLVLSDIEGLTYSDIANVLGVPLGTVKSRLSRARQILQVILYQYAVEIGYLKPTAQRSAMAGMQ